MHLEYDESKLDELRQQLENEYINKPEEIEEQIDEAATYIADKFISGNTKTTIDFQIPGEDEQRHFKFGIRKGIDHNFHQLIRIVVIDDDKFRKAELIGKRYYPFLLESEILPEYSYRDNLITICKAFFEKICGIIKPEQIDESTTPT